MVTHMNFSLGIFLWKVTMQYFLYHLSLMGDNNLMHFGNLYVHESYKKHIASTVAKQLALSIVKQNVHESYKGHSVSSVAYKLASQQRTKCA